MFQAVVASLKIFSIAIRCIHTRTLIDKNNYSLKTFFQIFGV